jgi:hypothetical protein
MTDNKPELLMAELHFILIQKRENHTLTVDDELWFEFTRPFYDRLSSQLDTPQITINLVTARLSGIVMTSTVFFGEPLNGQLCAAQRKKIEADADGHSKIDLTFAKKARDIINSFRKAV